MAAAQPARDRMNGRHQIRNRLRPCRFEMLLLGWRERLQVARHLQVTGRNEYQPFVLGTPLEFEQSLYGDAIVRITP